MQDVRIPFKKSTVRLETFFADANDVVRDVYVRPLKDETQ